MFVIILVLFYFISLAMSIRVKNQAEHTKFENEPDKCNPRCNAELEECWSKENIIKEFGSVQELSKQEAQAAGNNGTATAKGQAQVDVNSNKPY